jgi:hypothetical protein
MPLQEIRNKLKKAFRLLKKEAIRASIKRRSWDMFDVYVDETKSTGKFIGCCSITQSSNISIGYLRTKPAFSTQEIGVTICKILQDVGLKYTWSGNPSMCIMINIDEV